MSDDLDSGVRRRGQSSADVVEAMRQAIRAGDLMPGMQIKQADWALRLGVSRVPVREALGILEADGLLAHEPHQGYFVAVSSDHEIEQIYLLRRILDREIVQALEWPDGPRLAAMKATFRAAEACLERGDVAGWLACNDRFVLDVYALCPLDIVVGEAIKLWRRCETVRAGRIRHEWQRLDRETFRRSLLRILTMLEQRDRAGLKAAFARLTRDKQIPAVVRRPPVAVA